MFRVDVKYCPWASLASSWEVLKEDIALEEEAIAFANEVAAEHSQCTIRITSDDDLFYETTIES